MSTTSDCKRCGGTGRINFSAVEGGRCFACTGKADTSYTKNVETLTDEEAAERWARICAERKARRRNRG